MEQANFESLLNELGKVMTDGKVNIFLMAENESVATFFINPHTLSAHQVAAIPALAAKIAPK
jgi:hypothetical protein